MDKNVAGIPTKTEPVEATRSIQSLHETMGRVMELSEAVRDEATNLKRVMWGDETTAMEKDEEKSGLVPRMHSHLERIHQNLLDVRKILEQASQ